VITVRTPRFNGAKPPHQRVGAALGLSDVAGAWAGWVSEPSGGAGVASGGNGRAAGGSPENVDRMRAEFGGAGVARAI